MTYPYITKSVDLPGHCNISYIDEGSGPRTLIFVHGLANYAYVWCKNIDFLKKYFRCIAIDLPGNGLSDRYSHKYSMSFFGESINNFIEELQLKNVTLVGHSMGGQVALTTLINHPKCADSLVLCAPAGFERFSVLEKTMYYHTLTMLDFISSDEHSLRKTIERSFFHSQPQMENMINELTGLMKTYKPNQYRKMIEACIKSMLEDAVYDKLPQVKQPTLVLFGTQDALIPNKLIHPMSVEQLAKEGVKQLPYAFLEMIPDAGHFVQWEAAEVVNNSIYKFANSLIA